MKCIIHIQTNKSGTSREILKNCFKENCFNILLTDREKIQNKHQEYPEIQKIFLLKNLNFEVICELIEQNIIPYYKIETILSFVDNYVYLSSRLRDLYCFNPTNTKSIEVMENKLLTREMFKDTEYSIKHSSSKDVIFNTIKYPIVLKHPNSCASRNVNLIHSEKEFKNFNLDNLFIENYIEGEQFLIELFVKEKEIYIIGKFKQKILYSDTNSFIITDYILDQNNQITKEEDLFFNALIQKLEYFNGPLHLEYKINQDVIKLIEINPRPTGNSMIEAIEKATKINYAQQLIYFYLNKNYIIPKIKTNVYIKFLTSSKNGRLTKVTGKNKSLRIPHIDFIFIKKRKGNRIFLPRHMGDRLAYIISSNSSIENLENSIKEVSKTLNFQIDENK